MEFVNAPPPAVSTPPPLQPSVPWLYATVQFCSTDPGYRYAPHPENSQTPAAVAPGDPSNAEHIVKNWLECIRTRQKPVANEEAGYYSAMACFMANQAFQKKARIEWNPAWDLPA